MSPKKALECLILFMALALIYAYDLRGLYQPASCPTGPDEIPLSFALLVPILKFLCFAGWPVALLACLDPAWRDKDTAVVTLAAYAAATGFWIHKNGGVYCPKCVIIYLLPYLFSSLTGYKTGAWMGSWKLPANWIKRISIIVGILLMAFAALALMRTGAHATHPTASATPTAAISATGDTGTPVTSLSVAVPVNAGYSALVQKSAETPHLWQLDPRGGYKNGGAYYCGPVAVADSLVYLAHHGFPDLLPPGEGVQPQIDLVNELASTRYLGTVSDNGTKPTLVLSGIENYIVGQGYQCTTMEYKGWPKLARREEEFVQGTRPDLAWIRQGISNPHGAVWLNVGWYTRTGEGQWKRTGGHWVALVGCGDSDPQTLLIHNPSTPGKDSQTDDPAQDVVQLQPIAAGTLETGEGPAQDAAGRYQISGPGLPMGRDQVAFLDAAIVMVVAKL